VENGGRFFYGTGGMILYAKILDIFESGERERRRRGVANLNCRFSTRPPHRAVEI